MASQVRIEPPPSRLLLSQMATFEVLLIFMTMEMRTLDERIGQIVLMVIFFFNSLPLFQSYREGTMATWVLSVLFSE